MRRIALFAVLLTCAGTAHAATPVDVALVLVDDVSGSINDSEFALQKQGYAAAFADPQVLAAIAGGQSGAIAVRYLEFAGEDQVRNVTGWTVIRDAASARAFVRSLLAAPRSFRGRTAIGDGITLAIHDLDHVDTADGTALRAQRQVIDVCGDGTNNAGRPAGEARDEAVGRGITVNGLAIANESDIPWLQAHTHPPGGLPAYYRREVTGGEGSFVLEIHDYHSFGQAIVHKLVSEIAGTAPRPLKRAARRGPAPPPHA